MLYLRGAVSRKVPRLRRREVIKWVVDLEDILPAL